MKPPLSTDESSVMELHQSLSFSDVFGPNESSSFIQVDLVRASTPVSSDIDASAINTHSYDLSSCSILAPQNVSLVTQDLTASFSSLTLNQSPTKDDNSDVEVEDVHHDPSPPNFHTPIQLPDGYDHGFMCYGFKLVGDNLDKTI